MTWRTHPVTVALRSFGRRLRLNQLLSSLAPRRRYEEAYDTALRKTVKPLDCVWDVGANIGVYTEVFSTHVGREGSVYAFEPSPMTFRRLTERCGALTNTTLLPFGLGRADGVAHMKQGDDVLGATSRITSLSNDLPVDIKSADSVVNAGIAPVPNLIKIDVEGFELEVLEGMTTLLRNQRLRALGIEIHFGLLTDRGISNGPLLIERILQTHGFSIRWTDPSHIICERIVT